MKNVKLMFVVGARPNFMKIVPILSEMKKYSHRFTSILVHTGQHYDEKMSKVFFEDFKLPQPDINLEVGSDTHARQTAKIMMEFEKICLKERPDLVLVVGDVNSTLACSLVAAKLFISVAHVEAGLRSFDRGMPEEINRILTDRIADFLFTTCEDARINLKKEGVPSGKIFFVGNVMIDTLLKYKDRAESSKILDKLKLAPHDYAILTLHRPENVDTKGNFIKILGALAKIQKRIEIIFPVHPRTKKHIKSSGLGPTVKDMNNLSLINPLGYFDFLKLMINAKFVLTDSGGIQEETTVLNVPCLTLRENTERPITIRMGTNVLVGTDPKRIIKESMKILQGRGKRGRVPPLWDGKSARRIVRIFMEKAGN